MFENVYTLSGSLEYCNILREVSLFMLLFRRKVAITFRLIWIVLNNVTSINDPKAKFVNNFLFFTSPKGALDNHSYRELHENCFCKTFSIWRLIKRIKTETWNLLENLPPAQEILLIQNCYLTTILFKQAFLFWWNKIWHSYIMQICSKDKMM